MTLIYSNINNNFKIISYCNTRSINHIFEKIKNNVTLNLSLRELKPFFIQNNNNLETIFIHLFINQKRTKAKISNRAGLTQTVFYS